MKATFLFLIILFAAVACHEPVIEGEGIGENLCGVSNPLLELDWLHDEIEQINIQDHANIDFFVYSATYQGSPVFFVDICCPVCNVAPPEVRNCKGESLGRLGDGISTDKVVNRSLIWKTENHVCTRD